MGLFHHFGPDLYMLNRIAKPKGGTEEEKEFPKPTLLMNSIINLGTRKEHNEANQFTKTEQAAG